MLTFLRWALLTTVLMPKISLGAILIYDSNTRYQSALKAAERMGLEFVRARTADFNTLFDSQTWDLIILDMPSNRPDGDWQERVKSYVESGGYLITSNYYWGDAEDLLSTLGASAIRLDNEPSSLYPWVAGDPLWSTPNDLTTGLMGTSCSWSIKGVRFASEAPTLGGSSTEVSDNDAGVIFGNDERTLTFGFLFDCLQSDNNGNDIVDSIELVENAISRLLFKQGSNHTCLIHDGQLKCFGENSTGQLGLGDMDNRGDEAREMGRSLPAVDLGDFTPVAVKTGIDFTCALSDAGTLKCFGGNNFGQLGTEDSAARGDQAGEMGAALVPIDLGEDFRVKDFDLGAAHVCAVSTEGQLKCFGDSSYGQLGLGDLQSRGANPEDMGDNLPTVNLPAAVQSVSLGSSHTCVHLEDETVRCFGRGDQGQLGNGAMANIGEEPEHMGDALSAANLVSTGARIRAISAGIAHTCVLFVDGSVQCFGSNKFGQSGLEATAMSADPRVLDLGPGQKVEKLTCGLNHCCSLLRQKTVKCWGMNRHGQAGLGAIDSIGLAAGEMGEDLPFLRFGNLTQVLDVEAFGNHTCTVVREEGGRQLTKCFGLNAEGQLGQGHMNDLGNTDATQPRYLPAIDL